MLTQSMLTRTKYWPEIIPDTTLLGAIGAGSVGTPAPAEIRTIPNGYELKLRGFIVEPSADAELEFRTDNAVKRMRTNGLGQGYTPIDLSASKSFIFNVYNTSGLTAIASYSVGAQWMITKPTVAEKLFRNWQLTPEEKAIADELNVYSVVEKGIRPLTWEYMKDREYQVVDAWVENCKLDMTANASYTVLDIKSNNPNEFYVVDKIYCSNTDSANDITMSMKRDGDHDYVNLRAIGLRGTSGVIDCWVPALNEMIVAASSKAEIAGVNFRFNVKRLRLSNVLRARWGLVPDNELPPDVSKKVRGGIL